MTIPRTSVLRRLRSADEALRELVEIPGTLRANAAAATSLENLGERLLGDVDHATAAAFAEGLAAIVEAQIDSFPETLFWDIDFVATEILRLADSDRIASLCAEIVAVQHQYGRHSVLAFRYVHDFTYGFDWAKWVVCAPQERSNVRPFDPAFIAYLRRRGCELVTLIEQDDVKYPKLPSGRPRNPFGFSREPDHERLLFRDLAARRLLPVETWDPRAAPMADRPFAELRAARAEALGVPTQEGSSD